MTLEEYNQLDADFAHCSGEHCKQANECLRNPPTLCLRTTHKISI